MHKHVGYTEKTRCIDDMILRFQEERDNVVHLIQSQPEVLAKTLWTHFSPIPIDNECLAGFPCQKVVAKDKSVSFVQDVTRRDHLHLLRKTHKCTSCTNISRICDVKSEDTEFDIQYGDYEGKKLVLKRFCSDDKLHINLVNSVEEKLRIVNSIDERNPNNLVTNSAKAPNSTSSETRILMSDPYTNNILITWSLEHLETLQESENVLKLYSPFVCKNSRYLLYEAETSTLNEVSTLDEFLSKSKLSVKQILIQICKFLKNNPNLILGNRVEIQFVDSHIKLSNFENSRIIVNDVILTSNSRVCHSNQQNQIKVYSVSKNKQIVSHLYNKPFSDRPGHHNNSFYILLAKLLSNSTFQTSMLKYYPDLFAQLWLPSEYQEVLQDLKNEKTECDILKNKHFRHNVVDLILENL